MGKHLTLGRSALAAATACIVLAACAGPPPPTIRPKNATTAPLTGAALAQPAPRPQPAQPQPAQPQATQPQATPQPPTAREQASPPPGPPALAAVPVPAPAAPARGGKGPKPEQIVDQPGRAVRALLGTPDLQRREPPAEVWQYAAGTCVLDITFYPARDGGAARAAYLESRSINGGRLDPAVCLGNLGSVIED